MSHVFSFDVEQFIREIKDRPVIWDNNNDDYRLKWKREQAWEEIARIFIEDFDGMNATEKIDVHRKVFGKWRNIRDSYVRNLKKKGGQKRYMYSRYLTFLDSVYKTSDIQTDEDEWSEDGEEKKRTRSSTDFHDPDWQSGSENSEPQHPKRKKIKKEENPLSYLETPLLSEANFPVEDEDRSFFDSLLPAVRGFDMDQKLEFRSQVLTLVKKIRKGQKRETATIEFDDC